MSTSPGTETHGWEELANGLADMARDLLAQDSVQHTLDSIVAHAVNLVEGCEASGVMAVRGGEVLTLAVTDNVARASDRAQGELHEGPCFDAAYRKQQVYRVADMTATEQRWPRYAPKARELGVGSMMGFLLYTDGDTDVGALDMYSSQPHAFGELSERVGWLLASHAAVALSAARTNEQLLEAVGTRQEIGEALGIIMERHKVSEQDAFRTLKEISQHHNTKIRDLAHTINTTGEIPKTG